MPRQEQMISQLAKEDLFAADERAPVEDIKPRAYSPTPTQVTG